MNINLDLLCDSSRKSFVLNENTPLNFGRLRTDHIFLMDYQDSNWLNPRIVPYDKLSVSPGCMAIHYGQSIFEGAKAFLHDDNHVYGFRIDQNFKRLNQSAEILSMPAIPIEMQLAGLRALIQVDKQWMPTQPGSSMYIRPFMFATDDDFAVRPSETYTFGIILSPSGSYYPNGISKAITLLISETYHRAVKGGTGNAKAAGNYAASLRAQSQAKQHGADQVLYLDSTNTYLEEVGAMNHFHITADNELIIPTFTDTILESITSRSILELSKVIQSEIGLVPNQQTIKKDAFLQGIDDKYILEAGGFGTAAVATSVGKYLLESGRSYTVGNGLVGTKTKQIYSLYNAIQQGKHSAPAGWLEKLSD